VGDIILISKGAREVFLSYIGTNRGVYRLEGKSLKPLGLETHEIYAIHWIDGILLAGSYSQGVFRSEDVGLGRLFGWKALSSGAGRMEMVARGHIARGRHGGVCLLLRGLKFSE
jgi:hypothetical protein